MSINANSALNPNLEGLNARFSGLLKALAGKAARLFTREPQLPNLPVAGIKRILAITGAGVSQESDIATFRDKQGFWNTFNPLEFATAEAIADAPARVWAWADSLRMEILSSKPNQAHILLADLERWYEVLVCTQNVDGLHQKAGNTFVMEIHGNVMKARCDECRLEWELPEQLLFDKGYYRNYDPPLDQVPHCPSCLRPARPDVVLFREPYGPALKIVKSYSEKQLDLIIIIGTSGRVPTPYYIALEVFKKYRCPVIDINPGETKNDAEDLFPVLWRIRKPASIGMKLVHQALMKK